MSVITLPQGFDGREHLLHVSPGIGLFEAGVHSVEFTLVRARPDAELQSAVTVKIQQGGFTGNVDGMPIGRDDNSSTQTDTVGVGRPPSENLEGVGRNGHFQRMVFRRPDNMKAPSISHLDHLERVAFNRSHIGIRRDTLHIDR